MTTHEHYLANKRYFEEYAEYQGRYSAEPRFSDRKLIEIVRRRGGGDARRIVDLGCSTGNLLRHLRAAFPGAALLGIDRDANALAFAEKSNRDLGIEFRTADVLDVQLDTKADVVVLNAVSFYFNEADFRRLFAAVAGNLRPGGLVVSFDWHHKYDHQSITMNETSKGHPDGVTYHIRPQRAVTDVLTTAGFADVRFDDFELPVDLPDTEPDAEIVSRTETTVSGKRLCFRGVFFQPWCHVSAIAGPERA
jgi:trans-aconitate methyltransferase